MAKPQKINYLVVISDGKNPVTEYLQSVYETTVHSPNDIDVRLDTKYYTAKVNLKSFINLRDLAVWRSSNQEADVIAFCYCADRSQTTIDLTKLAALLQYFDFQCRIIACYQSCLSQPFATELIAWATFHSFEVVDLEPNNDDVSYYQEVRETYGVARIAEILHAAPWGFITEKKKQVPKPAYIEDSEDFDPFDGELDEHDLKALDKLFESVNVLDHYGFGNLVVPDGEMSLLEEEEKRAKNQKKKKQKKQKKDLDQGQESEDVDIELDQGDANDVVTSPTKETVAVPKIEEIVKVPEVAAIVTPVNEGAKKKKKKSNKKAETIEMKPCNSVVIDMSGAVPEDLPLKE